MDEGAAMPWGENAALVAHVDCAGGGQVWADGNRLYVGHMEPPVGTSIFDISDPARPVLLGQAEIPGGWHSHKVRAVGDLMVVNHERLPKTEPSAFSGGLAVYDVSDPTRPTQIGKWHTGGRGVHRFDFDGRYVYLASSDDGYRGNIVVIVDLEDPTQPAEISRWWIPGQWEAGGEHYPWGDYVVPRCHHPLRQGDRLYVSYWHHGFYILDIADLTHPLTVGHARRSPSFAAPTHTCLALPEPIKGRRYMVVSDEDAGKLRPSPPATAMVYDITDETTPISVATVDVPGLDVDGSPQDWFIGCHQSSERINGTVIPFAWFSQGLQVFDVAEPTAPRRVAQFRPDPAPGEDKPSSNDVTIDDRGLVYLIDRIQGLDVIRLEILT
jgi:hypothetical protein